MATDGSTELNEPLVSTAGPAAPSTAWNVAVGIYVMLVLLVTIPIGIALAVPVAIFVALAAAIVPAGEPPADSPAAQRLFRWSMRNMVPLFQCVNSMPGFALALVVPFATLCQMVGLMYQLSRRIRHGSVHGPGSGSDRVLRTPDECFGALPDYPFEPHYWEHDGMRLHYIDEGSGQGNNEVVLMVHGEPTWSFMFRKVVPQLVASGYRVICPDALGMGKSDKPLDPAQYSFANHIAALEALCDHLDIGPDKCNLTLVLHDWGGVVGTAAMPHVRPKRLVLLNTLSGPGEQEPHDFHMDMVITIWSSFVRCVGRDFDLPALFRALVFPASSSDEVDDGVLAGYSAPFPHADYMSLAITWPLVYTHGPNGIQKPLQEAQQQVAASYTGPVLLAMGTGDPIFVPERCERKAAQWLTKASAIERVDIDNASHFVAEAQPGAVATAICDFISKHSM